MYTGPLRFLFIIRIEQAPCDCRANSVIEGSRLHHQ